MHMCALVDARGKEAQEHTHSDKPPVSHRHVLLITDLADTQSRNSSNPGTPGIPIHPSQHIPSPASYRDHRVHALSLPHHSGACAHTTRRWHSLSRRAHLGHLLDTLALSCLRRLDQDQETSQLPGVYQ